jgi:hypothetical protein
VPAIAIVPPIRFLRALLVRGAILWGLTRLVVFFVFSAGEIDVSTIEILPAWAIVISACLVYADLRRRKELVLLHNLGVATRNAILIGTLPSVLIEASLLTISQ